MLHDERATADAILRAERAEHADVLAREREETDLDLSRERARADDAVATRDDFLGIVSHDLRNMLNAMVGFAALIEKEEALEDHAHNVLAHARRIHRAGARMNRLIGDLLDLASIQAGRLAVMPESGDPTTIVAEAVEAFQMQASAKDVTLVSEIEPSLGLASFDSARLLQVLVNLLSNAIKFTPPKGRVVVRVFGTDTALRFSVSDTGLGIPADKLDAVFQRFVQVTPHDRRGVGLGLYISKCIVEGHGGAIWAESRLHQGSTFSFTLPRQRGA